jgi:hypothetical protein
MCSEKYKRTGSKNTIQKIRMLDRHKLQRQKLLPFLSLMRACGPHWQHLYIRNWGIVVIRAERSHFHFVNITIPNITQPACDTLLVTSIGTSMQATGFRDGCLLIFPHLSDNLQQLWLSEAGVALRDFLKQMSEQNGLTAHAK